MSGNPHERKADGVTINKVIGIFMGGLITISVGVIAYTYQHNIDRTEQLLDKVTLNLDKIADKINEVNGQSVAAYGLAENNGAWLGRMEQENRDFRKETRAYWGQR